MSSTGKQMIRRQPPAPLPSREPSAYRDNIAVPGLVNGRYRKAAHGRLLDMFTPPGHHRTPAFYVIRPLRGIEVD